MPNVTELVEYYVAARDRIRSSSYFNDSIPLAKACLIVGILAYLVPALVIVMANEGWIGHGELYLHIIPIIAGIFFILGGRTNSNEKKIKDIPSSANPEDLRMEYQEINTAIRYRDLHITRLSYLSLAVVGILAAVFRGANKSFEPAVTVLGGLFTLYFLVSLSSMKGNLHALRQRRKMIEDRSEIFALNNVNRIVANPNGETESSRPFFSQFSASTLSVYLHYIVIAIWISLYLLSISWNL